MKKGLIQATDWYERLVHWMLALSCLFLCITGLAMMFHSFNSIANLMGGLRLLKYLHNFTGLFFGLALLLAIKMWWHEAGVFSMPEDLEWIKVAGGYLWHVDQVPEVGKYNPGQKMFFLAVAIFGVIMVITGLIMWFPSDVPRVARAMAVCAPCPGVRGDLTVFLCASLSGDHRFSRFRPCDVRRAGLRGPG